MRSLLALCAATAAASFALPGTSSGLPADLTEPAARDTEPVIVTGKDFAPWSTASNVTVKAPPTDLAECQTFDEKCKHNNHAEPEVDTQATLKLEGTPVDRLVGYRWDAAKRRFVQIPFQVDEVFIRYLDNSASGFSVYSGQDRHTSYAFDREGFRLSDPHGPRRRSATCM